jgi:hypothetical protein
LHDSIRLGTKSVVLYLSESGFSGFEDFPDKVKTRSGWFGFNPGNPDSDN